MNNFGLAVVPSYSALETLKSGSLVPVKTEFDEKRYNSIYVYHKNKWISPQMELALNLLKKYVGIVLGYFQCVPYRDHNHTKGKIYNYQQTTKNNIFSD